MRTAHDVVCITLFSALTFGAAEPVSAALMMKLIDSFETPAGGLPFIGPGSISAVSDSGVGILGTRTFTVSSPLAFGDAASIGGGSLQVFTGATAMHSTLAYLFPQLALPSNAGIGMDFRSLDSGFDKTTTKVRVTLTTDAGNLLASTALSDSGTPFSAFLPFSDFTGPGNLGSVTGIAFDINDSPTGGADFVLTQLTVADALVNPEPATMAFWCLAGAALLLARRHRKGLHLSCGLH